MVMSQRAWATEVRHSERQGEMGHVARRGIGHAAADACRLTPQMGPRVDGVARRPKEIDGATGPKRKGARMGQQVARARKKGHGWGSMRPEWKKWHGGGQVMRPGGRGKEGWGPKARAGGEAPCRAPDGGK